MENIYSKNGLQVVINASGRMTKLGVSTISKGVGEALAEAAGSYVVVEDLYRFAGRRIGSLVGMADACVTSSASAGIALSVASLICRGCLPNIQNFHDLLPSISKREVIMLKGQNVNFGAPVAAMVQLGGGRPVEAGYANGAALADIEAKVNDHTLAILFVKSHHCVQKDMPDAGAVIKLAGRLNIPCIVDAAAEEDLSIYGRMGADFVCYSGAKAIEVPTSGFTACKTSELAEHMRLQYHGIGRAMKVGKENVMGLLKALEEYTAGGQRTVVSKQDLQVFADRVNHIRGCSTEIVRDEAGREIYRCNIRFDEALYGMSAGEAASRLKEGRIAIYTRDYYANTGSIAIDPRPLNSQAELDLIYGRLKELAKGEENEQP